MNAVSRVRVERFLSASAFLARTEAFLLGAEVENNLMLGIARMGDAEALAAPSGA